MHIPASVYISPFPILVYCCLWNYLEERARTVNIHFEPTLMNVCLLFADKENVVMDIKAGSLTI